MPTSSHQDYNFSDKEFRLAVWLYEHRPHFYKALIYSILAFGGMLLVFAFINVAVIGLKFKNHRLAVLRGTQEAILFEDPAGVFSPRPIEVKALNIVRHTRGGADFLIELYNPNQTWAAFSFDYTVYIDEAPFQTKSSFALPGVMYVAAFMGEQSPFTNATVQVDNVRWFKINAPVERERLSLAQMPVTSERFVSGDKANVVDAVRFRLENKTPFGFWNVSAVAWIYKEGVLLGVGEIGAEQLASEEVRELEIGLGIVPVTSIDGIVVKPQVNIFDERNFM